MIKKFTRGIQVCDIFSIVLLNSLLFSISNLYIRREKPPEQSRVCSFNRLCKCQNLPRTPEASRRPPSHLEPQRSRTPESSTTARDYSEITLRRLHVRDFTETTLCKRQELRKLHSGDFTPEISRRQHSKRDNNSGLPWD